MRKLIYKGRRPADGPIVELFTDEALDTLRQMYAPIQTVDPAQPTYPRMCALLDRMSDPVLLQVAEAKIKFLSPLARNRCIRRGI